MFLYRSRRGDAPVEEYLKRQPLHHRRKIEARIALLTVEGPNLRRPYADLLTAPIRELRIGLGRLEHRSLYGFVMIDAIVLLHAFAKKTDAVPKREIDVAIARMDDFERRRAAGEELE